LGARRVRALADTFLAPPLKADVAAGKLDLLDALMAQIDLNRRLKAGRQPARSSRVPLGCFR